jgi:hypothetical protein
MKHKLLITVSLFAVILLNSSCYKTGEVIYQTICKPSEIDYSGNPLLQTPGIMFTGETAFQSYIAKPHMQFNYGGNNRRLIKATEINADGIATVITYSLSYDAANNITFMIFGVTGDPRIHTATFTYPSGTIGTITSQIAIKVSTYPIDEINQTLFFNYNTEFQLTSVTNINDQILKTLDYNFAGNCTKITNYRYTGTVQSIISTFEFLAYDDKVNPARNDRYLQLLLHSYSKNNPTIVKRTLFPDPSNPFPGTETANAAYNFYNLRDLPAIRNGFFFAAYDCINSN